MTYTLAVTTIDGEVEGFTVPSEVIRRWSAGAQLSWGGVIGEYIQHRGVFITEDRSAWIPIRQVAIVRLIKNIKGDKNGNEFMGADDGR